MSTIARLLRDNAGVTSIEYAVIAMLVGLAIIVGASALGTQINTTYESIAGQIPEV